MNLGQCGVSVVDHTEVSGGATVVDHLHAHRRMTEREPGCRTLVVSRGRRKLTPSRFHVVGTSLDMIKSLEEGRSNYDVVVLTGRFAQNQELVSFLSSTYPALRVLSGRPDEEPDTYLPPFA
jgi:hypothetical protein